MMKEFICAEGFLSEHEELHLIDHLITSSDIQWQRINRRRITHFGLKYDYPRFAVVHSPDIVPFPEYFLPFISRLYGLLEDKGIKLADGYFNQMTIQQYPPKSGIASHLDTTEYFGEYIAIISLQSHITMDFISATDKSNEVNVVLKRGSVAVLYGDSRHAFKHGIRERKTDLVDGRTERRGVRISITLRHALKSIPESRVY